MNRREPPAEELYPYEDIAHVAMILAMKILNVTGGTAYKCGDRLWTGFDWVICDTEADYNVARMSGLDQCNGRLITRADLYKLAIDKVFPK